VIRRPNMRVSVFCKRQDSELYHTNMSLSLQNLQGFVGGYIEVVHIGDFHGQHVVMICNDEGKLRGDLLGNFACVLHGELVDYIFGNVVFCSQDGEDLAPLVGRKKEFKAWLRNVAGMQV
jgi:hypothetical protein